jgi:hypothetical protein|nr:MAG TPA: hypothetical protein [Caudoviricetes sp.]
MKIIALKPCNFGGNKFLIGDEIPEELVQNPNEQKKRGVIAISQDGESIPMAKVTANVSEMKIPVVIHSEKGDLTIEVTQEELNVFFDVLQIPVSKTEDKQKVSVLIQSIESLDLLIMLDALDGRKFVKEESEKRADAITPDKEDSGTPEPNVDDADEKEPEGTPDDEQGGDE